MGELIGEFISELAEVLKMLKEANEIMEGADKAKDGKTPFVGGEKVEAQLKKLDTYAKDLNDLASKGVGAPVDKKVSMDELANPKTKSQAVQKFKDNLKNRDTFDANGRKLLASLKQVETEAQLRGKAAKDLSEGFKKLVESPIPDIGTVGKTTYFGLYQGFEEAAGKFNTISTNSKRAQARVTTDLGKVEDDTDTMRENLKTFGIK
jgi:hypothetical protein